MNLLMSDVFRVIYWDGKEPQQIDITRNQWKDLPNSILKIYDGNIEMFGYQGYILHDLGVIGINTTKVKGLTIPLEELITGELIKFGITIPDDKWIEVNKRSYI